MPRAVPVEVLHADAGAVRFDDDLHVFYLFNPFNEVILERVLENIRASLERHPRPVWVLTNKAALDAVHWLPLERAFDYGSAEFRVYTAR